jgi:hypothetical protein
VIVNVIDDICLANKSDNRENIIKYEEVAKTLPQVEIPVKHHIHGGMYGREITIPKGTIITGQIYKFDHFDIMVSGDITVSTDTDEAKRLTGFNLFKGMSGKKRAGYAHEETRWITFHPIDGGTGEQIQSYITAETFEDLNNFHNDINKADYKYFVEQSGMTQEQITAQVQNKDDFDDSDINGVYVSASIIEGVGLFASKKYFIGDVICTARVGNTRTLGGRYCNHAVLSNAEIILNENGADVLAVRDIEESEEITVNYRNVIKHRMLEGDL